MPLILKNIFSQKLKDISLEAGDGEILIISGPEGEGREEIFKVISGEVPANSGEIILNGKVIQPPGKTRAVFEDYVVYKWKVRKGVYLLSYRKWLRNVDKKKLGIVSEIMGMDRNFLLSPSPRHLSKGERKRFDLARYLITAREIILLDDPLIGLDWFKCKDTLAELKEIVARFNQPCLYKANSGRECGELKSRVALVKNGKIECLENGKLLD